MLREIGQAENIAVTDEEVDAEIERIAGSMGDEKEVERARQLLNRAEERDSIRSALWERKITSFLTDLAQQPIEQKPAAPEPEPEEAEEAGAQVEEKPKRPRAKKAAATQKD